MTDIPDLDGGQPDLSFRENAQAILPAVLEAFYAQGAVWQHRSGSSASIAHCRKAASLFDGVFRELLRQAVNQLSQIDSRATGVARQHPRLRCYDRVLHKRSSKLNSSEDVAVILSGVEQLIVDFKQRRTELSAEFVGLWQKRFKRYFKARLLKVLSNPDQQHEQI